MSFIRFTKGGVSFEVDLPEGTALADVAKDSPEIFKLISDIEDGGRAAEVFFARASTETPTPPVNASVPPSSSIPSCPHGLMKDLRGGKTKAGEPYKFAYYCDAKKEDATKCNPAGRN